MNNKEENPIYETAEKIEAAVEEITDATDGLIQPYRKTALHRFPTLFTLLVTLGVSATFFGFERIIDEVRWLAERPIAILLFGVAILILTGTLYKKLG